MKVALWIAFAVLALLWTGGAAAVAQLVQWSAQGLASGSAAPLGTAGAGVPMPSWLGGWIEPAVWAAAQQAVGGALSSLSDSLPAIGTAIGWLVPAVWVGWGLGFVALIVMTLLASWLLGRFGRGVGASPTPV
jgi:K+-transporting ATPase A subunit